MQLNIVIPHTHTLLAVVKHFGTSENENIPVKGSDGQKYLHSFRSEPHSVTQWGRLKWEWGRLKWEWGMNEW